MLTEPAENKRFFFEKKKQKTFTHCRIKPSPPNFSLPLVGRAGVGGGQRHSETHLTPNVIASRPCGVAIQDVESKT
jgi:hypothetical protein